MPPKKGAKGGGKADKTKQAAKSKVCMRCSAVVEEQQQNEARAHPFV